MGANNNKSNNSWDRIQQQIKARVGQDVYKSWFGRLKPVEVSGGVAVHSVPTAFLKSWLVSHYLDLLLELWQAEDPSILKVEIVVRSAVRKTVATSKSQPKPGVEKSNPGALNGKPLQPFMAQGLGDGAMQSGGERPNAFSGSSLDPKLTFENFIESSSNRMAYAAARSVAEDENGSASFNPLFIHASVGLGKTHLLQSIAWAAKKRSPRSKVLYLTAEYFMWRFAAALRDKTALSLKESLREIDLLLIDDMQFLQGKAIQQEFCHLLNDLIDSARQIVVAADKPPAELESLDERVKSRLRGGITLAIDMPNYELRKAILNNRYDQARLQRSDLEIPEDIRHYVARKVTTSCRDVEGAFNQLLVQHKFSSGPVSFKELDKMLSHLVRSQDLKKVRIEDIQKIVAHQFNVSRNDLLSNRRTRVIVRPRQIAMYLSKIMTPRSLPEIGRRFGGRDHTTVLHAVRKVEELCSQDQKMARELELLKRMILD